MATPKVRINLVDAQFDFPAPTKPTLFYAIASIQRTGSTFLCQQLWQTGVLGAPWEYFSYFTHMVRMIGRLQVNSIDEYVQKLFDLRTSPNGVFGFKMHPEHFEFIRIANLNRMFPGLRIIYVERRDTVAQAVSFAKALQTGQWTSLQLDQAKPAYDYEQIANCVKILRNSTDYWTKLFKRRRIQPLVVTYEDLIADPQTSVRQVLDRLGIEPSKSAVLEIPALEKQGDDVNQEWVERFRKEVRTKK